MPHGHHPELEPREDRWTFDQLPLASIRKTPVGVRGVNVEVVAAVVERADRFLLTRRQDGVHLAGLWEFPGGKVGGGESHADALRREMIEELDSDVAVHDLALETRHVYPDRTVTLFFYRCDLLGTPTPLIGQEMEWVPRENLTSLAFPPGDDELIRRLASREP